MTSASPLEGGFSRRLLRALIAVAVGSFLLAVVLSAVGPDFDSVRSHRADSFSFSAIGHRGLTEVLEAAGVAVVVRTRPGGAGAGPHWPLVLAEPSAPRNEEWFAQSLAAAKAKKSPVVLVLPKWQATEAEQRRGWAGRVNLLPATSVEAAFREIDPANFETLRLSQTIEQREFECQDEIHGNSLRIYLAFPRWLDRESGFEPIITCGDGVLVGRQGSLWLVSDPDLINNHGLHRGENARSARILFRDLLRAQGILLDETIHGYVRSTSLLAEAFRFPLWPATFQAALILALVLWAGIGRFGQPLPANAGQAAGKDVLIDNTASLLSAGGHLIDSLSRYHRQTLRAVGAALALPPGLSDSQLLEHLADHGRRLGFLQDPARLAQRIQRLAGRDIERRALSIAQDLHRWRRDMVKAP